MNICPFRFTNAMLTAYRLGALSPNTAARFERHILECDACNTTLERLSPILDALYQHGQDALDRPKRTAPKDG